MSPATRRVVASAWQERKQQPVTHGPLCQSARVAARASRTSPSVEARAKDSPGRAGGGHDAFPRAAPESGVRPAGRPQAVFPSPTGLDAGHCCRPAQATFFSLRSRTNSFPRILRHLRRPPSSPTFPTALCSPSEAKPTSTQERPIEVHRTRQRFSADSWAGTEKKGGPRSTT